MLNDSSGYADDILESLAKKYYAAKAKTQAVALETIGNEKAQGFLKGMPTRFLPTTSPFSPCTLYIIIICVVCDV